jgi:hypothetical protein
MAKKVKTEKKTATPKDSTNPAVAHFLIETLGEKQAKKVASGMKENAKSKGARGRFDGIEKAVASASAAA